MLATATFGTVGVETVDTVAAGTPSALNGDVVVVVVVIVLPGLDGVVDGSTNGGVVIIGI